MPEEQAGNFDDLFQETFESHSAVGSAEIEMRQILGNERFDTVVGFNDAQAQVSIDVDRANANRIQGLANIYEATSHVIPLAFLLAFIWSVYLGITWALH